MSKEKLKNEVQKALSKSMWDVCHIYGYGSMVFADYRDAINKAKAILKND